ncbi:ABC transporter ATP-binding protein [Paenibacillus oryzisoli]|uniref:ABC transporter ATP-binding protein n=1 Tax=Paenibacillus oryzisoli TaxID=1850517 RepID=UPI003D2CC8E4
MKVIRLFFRLTPFIKNRWKLTSFAYICSITSVALNLMQPIILSYLIDHVLIDKDLKWLYPLLGISIGCAGLSVILNIIRSATFRYLCIRNILDIRDVILSHIRKIPLTEIEKHGAGKFVAIMGMDAAVMGNFLNHIVVELSTQWFTMLFSITLIFFMDWRLGVIALISIPILLAIPRIFSKPIKRYVTHVRKHNEEIGTHLFESVEGSREIRAFGLDAWEKRRNDVMYGQLVKASTKETLFNVLSGQIAFFIISLIIVFIYGYGSQQIQAGALSIGMLVAATQYLYNVLNPIQIMNNYFGELQKGEVAMQRIESFLLSDTEPAVQIEANQTVKVKLMEPLMISCQRMVVAYEGIPLLNGVDFTVNRGQTAAFVGRSGSGKTTLLKTLLGFMPIDEGRLSIGNLPYEQWSRQSLSKHIGVVFQESYIFAGTLFENIALGNLSATEEEVYEAACQANLQSLIDSLPNGLYTPIDHKGFQLSGGQRQRIAIARVILKKPDILILDEPTASLDRESEDHVLQALKNLMQDKTTLISTHRMDTIAAADVIYVMDAGRIVDSGSHAELMKRSGLYQTLISKEVQMNKFGVSV